MTADIFTGKICSFYKNVVAFEADEVHLKTPGKTYNIIDVLSNERFTNGDLLNQLRVSGYNSPFYKKNKRYLSAACFSSIQDDLTITRSDANHLFHTGFITIDIDPGGNPSLLQSGGCDEMKEYIIENIPFIAYLGKSVSNLGLWGLVPILNKDDHYGHFTAIVEYFKVRQIFLDAPLSDISRLRFIAHDPDAHFELHPEIFSESLEISTESKISDWYDRRDVTEELFRVACMWVEAKHGIKFQPGSIHNYLLYLYSTLRYAHVSRDQILNWIYNNLIEPEKITTNCLDEIEFRKNGV